MKSSSGDMTPATQLANTFYRHYKSVYKSSVAESSPVLELPLKLNKK